MAIVLVVTDGQVTVSVVTPQVKSELERIDESRWYAEAQVKSELETIDESQWYAEAQGDADDLDETVKSEDGRDSDAEADIAEAHGAQGAYVRDDDAEDAAEDDADDAADAEDESWGAFAPECDKGLAQPFDNWQDEDLLPPEHDVPLSQDADVVPALDE